jgi:Fic family protein
MTGTSQVTASRQLNDLVKKGVLKPLAEQKGRSAAYELDISIRSSCAKYFK